MLKLYFKHKLFIHFIFRYFKIERTLIAIKRYFALKYLRNTDCWSLIERDISLNCGVYNSSDATKIIDLSRLHKNIVRRRPRRVLEYGSGMSTIVIYDALNKTASSNLEEPIEFYSLDESLDWIDILRKHAPFLGSNSKVKLELIVTNYRQLDSLGREIVCEKKLPINPDFVYVDGPTSNAAYLFDSFAGVGEPINVDVISYIQIMPINSTVIFDDRRGSVLDLLQRIKRPYLIQYSSMYSYTKLILL